MGAKSAALVVILIQEETRIEILQVRGLLHDVRAAEVITTSRILTAASSKVHEIDDANQWNLRNVPRHERELTDMENV